MKINKIAAAMLLGLFTFIPFSNGQLTFTLGEGVGTVGQTVDIPFTVQNFDTITTFEFEYNWDTTVVNLTSVIDVTDQVSGFSINSLGFPPNIAKGKLTGSFFNGDPTNPTVNLTLPDGALLFTLRFTLVGEMCDSTFVTLQDGAFYTGADFDFTELSSNEGKVKIDGADCNGGSGSETDLICDADEVTAQPGENVCVPITVQNFTGLSAGVGVGAGQGDISWNSNVLEFTAIQNNALPEEFALNNLIEPGPDGMDTIKFVWFYSLMSGSGTTLNDGDVLFDVCFDAVGDAGDNTAINLLEWGWEDNDFNEIPAQSRNGSVTLVAPPTEAFEISVSDTMGDQEERVCVDFTVNNFDNILGLEYRIQWDDSILNFGEVDTDIEMWNPALGSQSLIFTYFAGNNFITQAWPAPNGEPLDLPDGSLLYKVCFDVVGECDEESPVEIVPNAGQSEIVVSVEEGGTSFSLPSDRISITNGSIEVVCVNDSCSIITTEGACPGDDSGNVIVNVDTSRPCSWVDSDGNVVSTNCNLLGVPPGEYTLTANDGNCTLFATVPSLGSVTIAEGTVVNAGCGGGSISTSISDVSGTLEFGWDDPSIGQTLNPTGLEAGMYTITATDDRGCDASRTFTITEEIPELTVSPTTTSTSCHNTEDGEADLNISGGCEPYVIDWEGGFSGENPDDLPSGTHNYTITDSNGTEISGSVMITSPDPITPDGTPVIQGSTGADGSISIMVTGGTSPYNFTWSPGSHPNSNTITGLAAGMYSVVVEDANGCTTDLGPFDVPVINTNSDTIILTASAGMINCFGETTTVNVSAGGGSDVFPATLVFEGEGISETTVISSAGTTDFAMIGAGTYTATTTDSQNDVQQITIIVTEPLELEIDVDGVGCENDDLEDGFIDLIITGGTGDYSFEWSDPALDGASVDGLTAGLYTVMVTDENGCSVMMQNIQVITCGTPPPACYEFPDIITPNGDAKNDFFTASCLGDFPGEMTIFDRWGRVVFTMPAYDGTWQGTDLDGSDLIEGGYMWVYDINFGEGRREVLKGTVTVLRD